jgi:hypothetical protein
MHSHPSYSDICVTACHETVEVVTCPPLLSFDMNSLIVERCASQQELVSHISSKHQCALACTLCAHLDAQQSQHQLKLPTATAATTATVAAVTAANVAAATTATATAAQLARVSLVPVMLTSVSRGQAPAAARSSS